MPLQEFDRFGALRAFAAVGKRLSFNAAAEELGISPSALSRRIAQLEDRLGCRLLQRTTRHVTLSEAGAYYLDHCNETLTRMDKADAAVAVHAREPQGVLRLALPNLYGQLRIAPLLPAFMSRFPRLKLEVSFNDRFVDLVQHRIDVGVRIGNLETGDYVVRRLAPNKRVLCASPAYLDHAGHPATLTDLRDLQCLHFSPLADGNVWRLSRRGRKVELAVTPTLSADNANALRQAAIADQGVALLATFVVEEDLKSGRLVQVLPEWSVAESWIYAVYPHARFLPMKSRVFVDFLASEIRA